MIQARMRSGATWSDALILNMSSKGMLVRADQSPGRGSYLEIRRGAHVIVARVVWANSGRFGVQTQDPVPAASLIRNPDGPAAAKPAAGCEERRVAARPPELKHESSRQQARIAQFAAIILTCGLAAALLAGTVIEVVAKPFNAAQTALAAN